MSYLFDTDVLSNTLKKAPSPDLIRRLAATPPEEQFTSTITMGEMIYGARRSARAEELIARFNADLWPNLQILPFDVPAAEVYGVLRADLEAKGAPMAEADLRIASIALSRGLSLVTGNARHFRNVPGLTVEAWL